VSMSGKTNIRLVCPPITSYSTYLRVLPEQMEKKDARGNWLIRVHRKTAVKRKC